jgi:hypothetical protein
MGAVNTRSFWGNLSGAMLAAGSHALALKRHDPISVDVMLQHGDGAGAEGAKLVAKRLDVTIEIEQHNGQERVGAVAATLGPLDDRPVSKMSSRPRTRSPPRR